jgi:hypothetical protein
LASCVAFLTPTMAWAGRKPARASARYDLDILGMNDGDPFRLSGAAAQAVLEERSAVVFRFRATAWTDKDERGDWVPVVEVVSRYPSRPATDLVAVFQVDFERDRVPEVVLIVDGEALDDGQRYAPTFLKATDAGYSPLWAATRLQGERYRMVDVRDLSADGVPEVLLAGEAGRSGYYLFQELVGRWPQGFVSLPVPHTDSVHYVDLDRDRRVEIVMRVRVGRKGPAHQWTYVDQLYRWDGTEFGRADRHFVRYHDEETLPTLIGALLDHYDAKVPILMEKVEAIREVRKSVLELLPRPPGYDERVVKALALLQKGQQPAAKKRLDELEAAYPYDPQVLLALARINAGAQRWPVVLELGIQSLTVNPELRDGWWWSGVALANLQERSAALGSFFLAGRLGGGRDEGIGFLKARREAQEFSEPVEAILDEALEKLAR